MGEEINCLPSVACKASGNRSNGRAGRNIVEISRCSGNEFIDCSRMVFGQSLHCAIPNAGSIWSEPVSHDDPGCIGIEVIQLDGVLRVHGIESVTRIPALDWSNQWDGRRDRILRREFEAISAGEHLDHAPPNLPSLNLANGLEGNPVFLGNDSESVAG